MVNGTQQRLRYEAWTKTNIVNLGTNVTATLQKINATNFKTGIYNKTAYGNFRTNLPIPFADPRFQNLLFPVWQIAPIGPNAGAVFHDPHATVGSRFHTVEAALAAGGGGFTDVIQLLQDAYPRPSSILYAPLYTLPPNRRLMGFCAAIFSWDTALQNALPSYLKRIDLVLTTKTTVWTITVDQGAAKVRGPALLHLSMPLSKHLSTHFFMLRAKVLGKGDLHDPTFDQFKQIVDIDVSKYSSVSASDFGIAAYPSAAFYNQFISDVPFRVSIVVVFMVFFTMLVIVAYDFFIRKRETKLATQAQEAEDTTKIVSPRC
jgi:hypothetical protein